MPTKVVNQRQYQGFNALSYVLKKSKIDGLTVRNKRHIRKFPGDYVIDNADLNVDKTQDISNTENNVTSAILKPGSFICLSLSTDKLK